MATRRYRCNKCQRIFLANRPVCAPCGIDPRKNPRLGALIHKLETIHFEPPSEHFGIGTGEYACQPGQPHQGRQQATAVAHVVNCEACRETDVWKQAMAELGDSSILPEDDEFIQPEPLKS